MKGFVKTAIISSTVILALTNIGSSDSAAEANASIYESVIDNFQSPSSACIPEQAMVSNAADKTKDAQACLDIYPTARVALVNYAMSNKRARMLGLETQAIFNDSTEGIAIAKVTVIDASPTAKKLFAEENPNNCVELDPQKVRLQSFGSYVAAASMPSLKKYDKIIGFGGEPACETEAGESFQGALNRYSDVFKVAGASVSYDANNAAHELGHLYGFGHSGVLNNSASENLYGYTETLPDTGGVIDLDHYIAHGKYCEYCGDDIMGSSASDNRFTGLNVAEQYLLEWPNYVLNNDTPLTVSNLDEGKIVFNERSSLRSIALLNLPTPVHMPGETNQHNYDGQNFNTIAFVPKIFNGTVNGVEVYMIGDRDGVVDLGLLHSKQANQEGHFTITVGSRSVSVGADPLTNSVSIQAIAIG